MKLSIQLSAIIKLWGGLKMYTILYETYLNALFAWISFRLVPTATYNFHPDVRSR